MPRPRTGGRALSTAKIAAALRRGGRQRDIDSARPSRSTWRCALSTCTQPTSSLRPTRRDRGVAHEGHRRPQHPDRRARRRSSRRISASTRTLRSYRSLPGLGVVTGARVLGEFGDDPDRYDDAKARRNYAGTSPLTRASGTRRSCGPATSATSASPTPCTGGPSTPCTAHPVPEPSTTAAEPPATTHAAPYASLANRLVAILHGCLTHQHRLRRGHRLGPPQRPRRLTSPARGMSDSPALPLVTARSGRRWVDRRGPPVAPSYLQPVVAYR